MMSETDFKDLTVETGTGLCKIGKKLKRRTAEDPYELYLCEEGGAVLWSRSGYRAAANQSRVVAEGA